MGVNENDINISRFNNVISNIFKEEKFFLTPSGKVVQGVQSAGQIHDARILKQNIENTPAKLTQLQKEVNLLKRGQLELQEISPCDYEKFGINAGTIIYNNDKQLQMRFLSITI